jgi:two-component SAPR family response regulator
MRLLNRILAAEQRNVNSRYKKKGYFMLKLLLVSQDINPFNELISALKEYNDVELGISASGEEALAMISGNAVDFVIIDEDLGDMTGLELVKRILKINPMIDSAVVSRLGHDEFHEASEGLGIMAQLPQQPGREDARRLIKTLKQIKGIPANPA